MKHIRKHRKECHTYPDGNKFCAKFKEDINDATNSKPSASKFWFNDQKRRVPAKVSDFLSEADVTKDCGIYCDESFDEGLLTFEAPSSDMPGIGLVTNSIVSYSNLDDMCYDCA